MTEQPVPGSNEERWRRMLTGEEPLLIRGQHGFRHLPSPPRCKLCNVPFEGIGGAIFGRLGWARWPKNPRFCQQCHKSLAKLAVGGAEVEISVLFADVRGSTTLAEQMRPLEFRALIDRFYAVASKAIVDSDGLVDNYLGDGVLGLFIPVWSGRQHAARAVDAARQILEATGNAGGGEPAWLPVGAGVHTGLAFVGVVGDAGEASDFTALGDPLNTAARLAAAAAAGEVLVSDAAVRAGDIPIGAAPRRSLDLKGKSEPVEAVALRAGNPDGG
jgi:adenylate cyclase